ncbi:uncharacterized protein I303_102043 [Kwoniella dejecticola CBS 10117]|uniref:Uncharacterized protein n=1 Tax=Kwoniella dejecticola CBS 10117 TaxID=1296121 RepID=A0A1A6AC33_9TREE|nr:uncharacterized protein I303_01818 [Kwoniella dejecticola CBS 10117]OBR87610.1 hypothetical protein I303_01818 [Kwoniella dejecticola CBS 10117]
MIAFSLPYALLLPPLIHLSTLPGVSAETSTPNTGDQVQSFLFGFAPQSNLVLPIVPSCPSPLTLSPLTPTNAKTSDPKAPYTMIALVHEQLMDGKGVQYERLYSAGLDVGDMSKVRNIQHPWMNGTQFIACIWGSNGASGGCQDLMTVVPSEETFDAYASPNSTCRAPDVLESWVTPANETLDVEVLGASGDVSWNAWPSTCSDLQINPKNGTPPYTLLVAPAAHPPVNITTSTLPINYTIRLTHGQAFMLGLYDSSGKSWAFGPLHAGESTDLSCLAVATGQDVPEKETTIGVSALAGGIAGAFVAGCLGAALLMWCLMGRGKKVRKSSSEQNLYSDPRPASYSTSTNSFIGKQLSPGGGNTVTPYTDSPRLDFEFGTPATLYDPHVIGPNPQNYPRPPLVAGSSSNSNSGVYTVNDSYRDNISLNEYRNNGPGGSGPQLSPLLGYTTKGGRQASGSSLGPPTPPGSGGAQRHPSSPRPGSFGSAHNSGNHSQNTNTNSNSNNQNDEPSSPTSLRGMMQRNVYVVHSDGGNGDLHIQLPDSNSRVIELPPNYRPGPDDQDENNPNTAVNGSGVGRDATPITLHPLPSPPTPINRASAQDLALQPTRSQDMSEDELRARAQARMKEKVRYERGHGHGHSQTEST